MVEPAEYVSVRLNCDRASLDGLLALSKEIDYIVYPHNGKTGNNPHYHVLYLDDKPEKYRKRIRDRGLAGNKKFSVKHFKNGLYHGIQYCAREHTEPIVSSDAMLAHIEAAPVWVQTTIPTVDAHGKCTEKDWQLGYVNLVSVAVKHARDNSLIDHTLKYVVEDLIAKTKWRPSKYLICGGVPAFYEEDFLFRLKKRQRPNMDWWTPRI